VLPSARTLPFPSVSGGPLALGAVGERWSSSRRCRLGPRVSRSRFPAAASRRRRRRQFGIRSSRARPRLDGAPLRRRRCARGGGVRFCRPVYRSSIWVRLFFVVFVRRRIWRLGSRMQRWLSVLRLDGVWIELDSPAASGVDELWSRIGGARGVPPADVPSTAIQSRRLRRVATAATQSLCAIGLLQFFGGHGVFFPDDDRHRLHGGGRGRNLAFSGSMGSRDLIVISCFLRGLCARWFGQLSMYPPLSYLYAYVYGFPTQ